MRQAVRKVLSTFTANSFTQHLSVVRIAWAKIMCSEFDATALACSMLLDAVHNACEQCCLLVAADASPLERTRGMRVLMLADNIFTCAVKQRLKDDDAFLLTAVRTFSAEADASIADAPGTLKLTAPLPEDDIAALNDLLEIERPTVITFTSSMMTSCAQTWLATCSALDNELGAKAAHMSSIDLPLYVDGADEVFLKALDEKALSKAVMSLDAAIEAVKAFAAGVSREARCVAPGWSAGQAVMHAGLTALCVASLLRIMRSRADPAKKAKQAADAMHVASERNLAVPASIQARATELMKQ